MELGDYDYSKCITCCKALAFLVPNSTVHSGRFGEVTRTSASELATTGRHG